MLTRNTRYIYIVYTAPTGASMTTIRCQFCEFFVEGETALIADAAVMEHIKKMHPNEKLTP
jgi:hypothetical protein